MTAERAAELVHRHRAVLLGLAGTLVVVALVWIASLPTGAASAAATIGEGERLAVSAPVDDVEVLVVSRGGVLSVRVAYESPKGWLDLGLPSAPAEAVAAWAGTDGRDPVPALSAVYGRAPGVTVQVVWADGVETTARAESDGVYLAARPGHVRAELVRVLDADGTPTVEIEGP